MKIEATDASMSPTLSNSCRVSSVDDNEQVSEPPMYKQYEASCKELSHYLETLNSEASAAYSIPAHILRRYQLMDIVVPTDRHSCCFTKGWVRCSYISVVYFTTDLEHRALELEITRCVKIVKTVANTLFPIDFAQTYSQSNLGQFKRRRKVFQVSLCLAVDCPHSQVTVTVG